MPGTSAARAWRWEPSYGWCVRSGSAWTNGTGGGPGWITGSIWSGKPSTTGRRSASACRNASRGCLPRPPSGRTRRRRLARRPLGLRQRDAGPAAIAAASRPEPLPADPDAACRPQPELGLQRGHHRLRGATPDLWNGITANRGFVAFRSVATCCRRFAATAFLRQPAGNNLASGLWGASDSTDGKAGARIRREESDVRSMRAAFRPSFFPHSGECGYLAETRATHSPCGGLTPLAGIAYDALPRGMGFPRRGGPERVDR
jgi:hypothetical protein